MAIRIEYHDESVELVGTRLVGQVSSPIIDDLLRETSFFASISFEPQLKCVRTIEVSDFASDEEATPRYTCKTFPAPPTEAESTYLQYGECSMKDR